jgi:hypothetical protein
MKISYLILAHSDPEHLGRLISALDNGNNTFFIHIDRKIPVGPFTRAIPPSPKVVFLKKRKNISWGGFSIVAATILLIREAFARSDQADYFVLLSGLDYPIKSNAAIDEFLSSHPGRQYLRYTRMADCPFLRGKITRYHFFDMHRRIGGYLETIIGRILPERPFLQGMVPYFGSQWWALSHECISYIVSFIDNNPRYVRFYRFAGIPDEMFFHTIILNSVFLQHTDTRVSPTKWDAYETPVPEAGEHIKYMDWNLSREQPAILDDRDFERLQSSAMLFARKFTTEKSSGLIERLNRELLHYEAPHLGGECNI